MKQNTIGLKFYLVYKHSTVPVLNSITVDSNLLFIKIYSSLLLLYCLSASY